MLFGLAGNSACAISEEIGFYFLLQMLLLRRGLGRVQYAGAAHLEI